MSDEKWIKFEDEMPKLNQNIQIKEKDGNIFTKVKFCKSPYDSCSLIFIKENIVIVLEDIESWRPLPEKRPDFGKEK